jgi:hypothetical protein
LICVGPSGAIVPAKNAIRVTMPTMTKPTIESL